MTFLRIEIILSFYNYRVNVHQGRFFPPTVDKIEGSVVSLGAMVAITYVRPPHLRVVNYRGYANDIIE